MSELPPTWIIIPTYDELENVKTLVPDLLSRGPNLEILIVDDNSPDGTGKWVEEFARTVPRVHVLHRPGKMGLGSAYRDGFRLALDRGAELIFEMDADFSHDPDALPSFFEAVREADLVLGSRYKKGVTVDNWPLERLMLSYFANVYTRWMTGLPVRDATGGYKCFRRVVLESIDLGSIRSDGYAFQIEMTFEAFRLGFRIAEIPIVFVDRRVGISKMSKGIVGEAFFLVFRLALRRIFTRRRKRGPSGATGAA